MTPRTTCTFRAANSASPSRRATFCTSSTRMTPTGGRRTARARTTRHSLDSYPAAPSRNSQYRYILILVVGYIVIVHARTTRPLLDSYPAAPSRNSQYRDILILVVGYIVIVHARTTRPLLDSYPAAPSRNSQYS